LKLVFVSELSYLRLLLAMVGEPFRVEEETILPPVLGKETALLKASFLDYHGKLAFNLTKVLQCSSAQVRKRSS